MTRVRPKDEHAVTAKRSDIICWKKKKFAPVHAINDMDMTNMMEAYKEIEQPMPSPGTQTPPAMIDDHDYKF